MYIVWLRTSSISLLRDNVCVVVAVVAVRLRVLELVSGSGRVLVACDVSLDVVVSSHVRVVDDELVFVVYDTVLNVLDVIDVVLRLVVDVEVDETSQPYTSTSLRLKVLYLGVLFSYFIVVNIAYRLLPGRIISRYRPAT